MTDPTTPAPTLPALTVAFLTLPSTPGEGGSVRAQVTSYASPDALDGAVLVYGLLLYSWELTAASDGSQAELFARTSATTIALSGNWRTALRDLRTLLADPRLELLLAAPPSPSGGAA